MRLTEIDGKCLQARKRLDRGVKGHSETEGNPVQGRKDTIRGEKLLGRLCGDMASVRLAQVH